GDMRNAGVDVDGDARGVAVARFVDRLAGDCLPRAVVVQDDVGRAGGDAAQGVAAGEADGDGGVVPAGGVRRGRDVRVDRRQGEIDGERRRDGRRARGVGADDGQRVR